MKMKALFSLFLILACSFAFLVEECDAQIKRIEYGTLALDSLTDAGTKLFAYPNVTSDVYDLSWQVAISNVSGTTKAFVYIEASNCQSCADWAVIRTDSLLAAGNLYFNIENFPGLRVRARVVGEGTQVSNVRNHYFWKRRSR